MITIFHGINTPTSRKAFINAREKAPNPVTVDGVKVTLTDLAQILTGEALFAEEKNLFIEEFFSKRKKSKEADALVDFINKNIKENNVFIWESKELTASQAKAFTGAKIEKFDVPKTIFAFLESLSPGNSIKSIALFHKTLETEEAEFIFFMIVRHMRILLAVSDSHSGASAIESVEKGPYRTKVLQDDNTQIDEVKRMAPWLKGKAAKQANGFSEDSLLNFYTNLFTIESGLKTGTLATNLTQAIDFLLLTL